MKTATIYVWRNYNAFSEKYKRYQPSRYEISGTGGGNEIVLLAQKPENESENFVLDSRKCFY